MARAITIAAAQYPLTAFRSLQEYRSKITAWVEDAMRSLPDLIVFPEYGSMELCSLGNRGLDLQDSITAVSDLVPEITGLHSDLARKHGCVIITGSGPRRKNTDTVNTAYVCGANGTVEHFDKLMPTPWEREPWHISAGRELKLFDISGVKVGLLICYDIEFPLLARALAEAGAQVIVAPSNTETEWGYWRVRTGAAARALENQIYTVQSPVVGHAPFCAACENNTGAAGFFAPPDRGFPPNGVLALGEMNKSQWLIEKLDLDLLAEVRQSGGVQTYKHWSEQLGVSDLPKAQLFKMRD
jgi:predicted amidohydrolase